MIKLLFTRKRSIGSWIIRFRTWSNYSHVDIVDGDDAIGALAFEGVKVRNIKDVIDEASDYRVVIVEGDEQKAIEYAKSKIGKKYDWLAIFGIGLKTGWESSGRYMCSEFVNQALIEGGTKLFDSKYDGRVTPEHIYMLNNQKTKELWT